MRFVKSGQTSCRAIVKAVSCLVVLAGCILGLTACGAGQPVGKDGIAMPKADAQAMRDMSEEIANPNAIGNTSANINNMGMAVAQGNWVYFAVRSEIYRAENTSTDFTQAEKIYEGEGGIYGLNISGKDLFFSECINEKFTLMHIDVETGSCEKISQDQLWGGMIWLENGSLFCSVMRQVSATETSYLLLRKDISQLADGAEQVIYTGTNPISNIFGIVQGTIYFEYREGSSQEYGYRYFAVGADSTTGEIKTEIPLSDILDFEPYSYLGYGSPQVRFSEKDDLLYILVSGDDKAGIAIYDLAQGQLTKPFGVEEWPYSSALNFIDNSLVVGMEEKGMMKIQLDADSSLINGDVPDLICVAGDNIFYYFNSKDGTGYRSHVVKTDGTGYQELSYSSMNKE